MRSWTVLFLVSWSPLFSPFVLPCLVSFFSSSSSFFFFRHHSGKNSFIRRLLLYRNHARRNARSRQWDQWNEERCRREKYKRDRELKSRPVSPPTLRNLISRKATRPKFIASNYFARSSSFRDSSLIEGYSQEKEIEKEKKEEKKKKTVARCARFPLTSPLASSLLWWMSSVNIVYKTGATI